MNRDALLSEHFTLGELVGTVSSDPPDDVLTNLTALCTTVLEPVRQWAGAPVVIHDGWRPTVVNLVVGGVKDSDHLTGKAADFHVAESPDQPWQERTIEAFHWIVANLAGKFGQVILEDHRQHYGNPNKLWVHVAIPSDKHPGDGTDLNAVLTSSAPRKYAACSG